MKKMLFLMLSIGLLAFGCEDNSLDNDCLPYEGEFFDSGNACSGIVIKVLNKDVNSLWNRGDETFENVIGVRFEPTVVDSVLIDKKFYFDFRELKPEETYPCPTLWTAPNRIVFITRVSLEQCASNVE